jgi:alpha-L-fucosidase
MTFSRRRIVQAGAAGLAAPLIPGVASAAPAGPFTGSWDSLAAGYKLPDWFRDAKFGIWAHWSAQCVPERGDWYGRLMYVQGDEHYDDHVKRFGHPSQFGFMEFDNLWKVDAWEPEALMGLYKAAGAKYFVSLACHHDNFDTFDSAHHPWNATRIGPKRDIVGTWAKIARAHGLRFGVSNHASHAWHWWQTAYGYDAEGPMKGQRYDAYRLTKADGVGKWWEGLDPQELYTGPYFVPPDGISSIKEMNDWHGARDGQWHEEAPPNNPAFTAKWLARCKDLMDKYQPDYVYFDDEGLPLGQAGLDATAHYYNADWTRRGGHMEVVVTGKRLDALKRRAVVEDVERGFADALKPDPWQTCTCIGNWHYDRRIFEKHGYKTALAVVQRLADTVSKNGNLLLSIPVRGNGAIDEDEAAILHELAGWMAVNGEAIFATRPWRTYGEGPTQVAGGMFSEEKFKGFTASDIRFTTKAGALYALILDQPKGEVVIQALAEGQPGRVERVELLGASGPLPFTRGTQGLTVRTPETTPAFTPVLRIQGAGLA